MGKFYSMQRDARENVGSWGTASRSTGLSECEWEGREERHGRLRPHLQPLRGGWIRPKSSKDVPKGLQQGVMLLSS